MEKDQVSVTALISAYIRSYHAEHDKAKVFDDFLARQLLTEEEYLSIGQNLSAGINFFAPEQAASCPDQTTALAAVMRAVSTPILISRARYTEDNLESAVRKGVQQYIILGAGFDTFAFRRPELVKQLHIFEVDHPHTQIAKRRRIAELQWAIPPQLDFIAADFSKDNLASALKVSPYDDHKLSFFSWLGVTYYLSREAILATLHSISKISPKGSSIIFDYLDSDAFIPEKASARVTRMQDAARFSGEPMLTGFHPPALAADLESAGFYLYEDLNPLNIEQRYFQDPLNSYSAFDHLHLARAVVK